LKPISEYSVGLSLPLALSLACSHALSLARLGSPHCCRRRICGVAGAIASEVTLLIAFETDKGPGGTAVDVGGAEFGDMAESLAFITFLFGGAIPGHVAVTSALVAINPGFLDSARRHSPEATSHHPAHSSTSRAATAATASASSREPTHV